MNVEMTNDKAKTWECDSICQGMQTKRMERGGWDWGVGRDSAWIVKMQRSF